MKYLTESQIKKFQDDGFLLLKKFFSEEEMEPINKSIEKFSRRSCFVYDVCFHRVIFSNESNRMDLI